MSNDDIANSPVYVDARLIEDFDAPEFWILRIAKVEFASAGVVRITYGTGRDGRLTPACSVLVPVENLQRSVDLLVAASQTVAARSYVVADFHELRAAH